MSAGIRCRIGRHAWRTVMVTDETWPQHRGHGERVCTRCGKRKRP